MRWSSLEIRVKELEPFFQAKHVVFEFDSVLLILSLDYCLEHVFTAVYSF